MRVDIVKVEEVELDEMWSFVGKKSNQRWLWHAIDHNTHEVLAYHFGKRKNKAFKALDNRFCLNRIHNLKLKTEHKQINIFANGCSYQLPISKIQTFTNQLCDFDSIIKQNNLKMCAAIEYHPNRLEKLTHIYRRDYLMMMHTALKPEEIQHQQLLPVNSTCFSPKPAHNSLTLLNSLMNALI